MTRTPAIVLVLAASIAVAEPETRVVDLRLKREPTPRTLRMRRPVAQTPPAPGPSRPKTPMPVAPTITATAPAPVEEIEGLRDVSQPVSFSLTMGYQVDGARSSGKPTLQGGDPPNPTSSGMPRADYADLRSYGFGEGFLSTRGVGINSLETFFAVRFQAARNITSESMDDLTDQVKVTSPIATWFQKSGAELRSGWAEVKDFLPKRFGLSKLRVRGGSQFVYGPWILHLDGVNIAYEGPTVTAQLYAGPRHTDYTRDDATEIRPIAYGAGLKIDLRGLTEAVPIAVSGDVLSLSESKTEDRVVQPAIDTAQVQADWRPNRDVVVIGSMRGVNGKLANQRIEVRSRYNQVTNFVFDVTRRLAGDWLWDPAFARVGDQALSTNRYLDMGALRPQLIASARAGTLIRENIDLLARISLGIDALQETQNPTSYTAPYFEVGGAVEVRLRRQAAFALSILSRQTTRETMDPIVDMPTNPLAPVADGAPIPDIRLNVLGEQGFTEGGGILKLTLGARRFSAAVEAYVRRTRYSVIYSDPDPEKAVPDDDVRGGGRVTLDAWVGQKIRVFVQYDVSSALDTAPEISGYKSLRLTLTGLY